MLRTLDHRLNSRHTYSLVHRCCTFPRNLKPRTGRSSPCPCSALEVPAAKIINPPPPPPPSPVVVVISNALRYVVKPLLPPMSDSSIAGHMSNLMKLQQPPALPSHLLRGGGPFSARAALPLQKPTLPLPLPPPPCRGGGGGVPLLLPAAAAGSSLYNYYITNFNFNAAAAATARRQFSTSPSSTDPVPQGSTPPYFPAADERPAVNVNQGGDAHAVVISSSSSSEASNGGSMPSLIGSEGRFQSSGNTQKLDVVDDMESQMSKNTPFWDFLILALRALVFFYMFFRSVAGVDIRTSPLTNRKIIVRDHKKLEELDKFFRETITGSETLPSTDHFSCKVRSILEGILSNMDKVIKQRPQSLTGIKWEIVASKVPGVVVASAYRSGKIIINPNSLQHIDTDGMLAFIIGHEVAHIVAEHSNEQFGNFRLGAGLIAFMHALCIVYIRQPPTFLGFSLFPLLASLCLFIRLLCLSQRHELEADNIGMLLSASAGYDPREAINYFFIGALRVVRSGIPSFLRVHPPRLKRAEELLLNMKMEKALAIYKNN